MSLVKAAGLGGARKPKAHCMRAEAKDPAQLGADEQRIERAAGSSQRRSVVDAVLDHSLGAGGTEMMLMPPRLVRPALLAIDEQLIRAPFLDPRPPSQR